MAANVGPHSLVALALRLGNYRWHGVDLLDLTPMEEFIHKQKEKEKSQTTSS